eukprot:TRINITY_DN10780_c0_g1_i2.p1 TRINITY_DN10780_c0_g1~~TRINITY_DN10780_c0_g1_i2.p1  ORF type:complete len:105 (+),score=3.04 TRINITY_DN10780_c0_g1_i2:135-449(+)
MLQNLPLSQAQIAAVQVIEPISTMFCTIAHRSCRTTSARHLSPQAFDTTLKVISCCARIHALLARQVASPSCIHRSCLHNVENTGCTQFRAGWADNPISTIAQA